MGRIHLLDDGLVNRIAAGEVVERPASVVKELVENSLDAGASRVHVTLEGGGKRRIVVQDDGSGMDRQDALLALERHATSKLRSASDLDRIQTLGFRGEALPSIAAVSRFLMKTAARSGEGTEILVEGGKILQVRDAGVPRGTTVHVERLFGTVPARRKFLRSDATELAHVLRRLQRFALAFPNVAFRVEHGGRVHMDVEAAEHLEERLRQLVGESVFSRLLPAALEAGSWKVSGFVGRPADSRSRRDATAFFVNGRQVQDRVLAHAVREAFENTLPRDRHPDVYLFLELPPDAVDVNVHPQKTEVRFREPSAVHDLVRRAVRLALADAAGVPGYHDLRPGAPQGARDALARWAESPPGARPSPHEGEKAPRTAPVAVSEPVDSPGPAPSLPLRDTSFRVLGQYQESYIVAEHAGALVLVDQHAAHERVIFERMLREADARPLPRQDLLQPLVLDLTPEEASLLETEQEEFRRLGIEVEPFGRRQARVRTVPAAAGAVSAEPLVRELLGEAARVRSVATGAGSLRHRLVTTAACHAAIKVHDRLTRETMDALLRDLVEAENPATCPHGRPVFFRLGLEEIERAFRRR